MLFNNYYNESRKDVVFVLLLAHSNLIIKLFVFVFCHERQLRTLLLVATLRLVDCLWLVILGWAIEVFEEVERTKQGVLLTLVVDTCHSHIRLMIAFLLSFIVNVQR